MPLPLSGPISFNDINVELGVSGTTQASLGQASYRTLAGVPSGQISMSNFYGKANQFAFTISSPTNNANLASLASAAGWPGATKLVATVAPGVVLSSSSTGVSALTISGSFPGGVELINNGTIVGMGGNGGQAGYVDSRPTGLPGGPALTVLSAVTINNLGTIAGGGGGGGSGVNGPSRAGPRPGGSGGGGRSSLTNSAGGTPSPSGGNAGQPGTFSSAGNGGGGVAPGTPGGPGGGWGAGGTPGAARPGGNGGSAVSGNPNITWINFGTRLGGIS